MRTAVLLVAVAIGIAGIAAPAAPARERHPPVVMLVFDEFAATSLLDAHGRIDAARFPNFARLAAGATRFPRYTAPGDETGPVMTTLLAGAPFQRGASPSYASHPDNLFTRMRRSYALRVNEEVTGFCPHCPGNAPPRSRQAALTRIAHQRTQRFDRWLGRITRARRPTFYFKHVLLPHGPAVYLPSGQRYNASAQEPIPGLNTPGSFGDPWFVRQSWQRYLLQVQLADRLLGKLVARLKAQRLYDRSLLVVTADNGEAFGYVGADPHRTDGRTAADVAATPFIVKLPGQRRARVVRHHARTLDVEPTILRRAAVSTRGLPGRDAFGTGAGIPAGVSVADDEGRVRTFSPRAFTAALRAIVRRKAKAFGNGLYEIGPAHGLVGRPLGVLRVVKARGVRAVVQNAADYRDVRPRGFFLPAFVVARLEGRPVRAGVAFAVAVNGRVAVTGRVGRIRGSAHAWATALVPPGALRAGGNAVTLLLIDRDGRLERL